MWTEPSAQFVETRPEAGSRAGRTRLTLILAALWLAAFFIYWGMATRGTFSTRQTYAPQFVYLADALLHGQVHLRVTPPEVRELAPFKGELFLYQPPMPAVLMLPYVAVFGLAASDRIFGAGLGALNVVLVVLVARAVLRRAGRWTWGTVAVVALFWALGSDQTSSVVLANVYVLPHVATATFLLAALLVVIERPPGTSAGLLVGAALAGALLTRVHTVLAAPVLLWGWLYAPAGGSRRGRRVGALAGAALTLGLGVAAMLFYNRLRFDQYLVNPIDYQYLGTATDEVASQTTQPASAHGRLSLGVVPRNLYYYFANVRLRLWRGWPVFDPMGQALWFTSPLLLLLLRRGTWWRCTAARWGVLAALPVLAFVLLWPFTGASQIGLRYVGDFLALLMPALTLAVASTPRKLVAVLLALCIVVRLYATALAPLTLNLHIT